MDGYRITRSTAEALARKLKATTQTTPSRRGVFVDSSYSRVRLAQAPQGGVPQRVGNTPGSILCFEVIIAPSAGAGYSEGDLVKTNRQFIVLNWDLTKHAEDGDRIIQVSSHSDGAFLIGASCFNEEDPNNIVALDGAPAPIIINPFSAEFSAEFS